MLTSKSAVPRVFFRDILGACETPATLNDGFADEKPPFCIESLVVGGPDCSSVAKTAPGTILAVRIDEWPPFRWSPILDPAYTIPVKTQMQQQKEAPLTRAMVTTVVTVAAPEVDSSGLISQVGRSHCPSVQVATPVAM